MDDIESATPESNRAGQRQRGCAQCLLQACAQVGSRLKAYCSIIVASPMLLIAPLALLGLLIGLGMWALDVFADHARDELFNKSQQMATGSAYALESLMTQLCQPVYTMATLLQLTVSWVTFEPYFATIAATLYDAAPGDYMTNIVVRPNAGFALGVYPSNATTYAKADLLHDPQYRQVILTLIRNGQLSVDVDAASVTAQGVSFMRIRMPVFISNVAANETFGLPPIDGCPVEICYHNATSAKFWGMVSAGIDMSSFVDLSNPYLESLTRSQYLVKLTKTNDNTSIPDYTISRTSTQPGNNAVHAELNIPGGVWVLSIEPESGWDVVWKGPAIVAVVVISVFLSLLLLMLLISRRENEMLLRALVPQSVIEKVKAEEGYVAHLKSSSSMRVADTGTPAEKILALVSCLLDGGTPTTKDLVQIRHALMEGANLFKPMDLEEQMAATLDSDVQQALIKTLGGMRGRGNDDSPFEDRARLMMIGEFGGATSQRAMGDSNCPSYNDFSTVRGGLQAILTSFQMDAASDAGSSRPSSAAITLKPDNMAYLDNISLSSRDQMFMTAPQGSGCGTPTAAANDGLGRAAFELGWAAGGLATKSTSCTEITLKVPRVALLEEVESLLAAGASSWKFDAFALDEASMGHSLSTLGFFLIQRGGLLQGFTGSPHALARYLCAVEAGYKSNPYHNNVHATSVLHAMHMFICYGGLMPGYVDSLSHLGCYLAAIIHDYEHKGLTNDFLINSCDSLATLYNDRSPMENHHLAAAFELLRQPQHNFLANLPRSNMASLRKLVIDLVLATDMKQHFATVSQFSTVHMVASNADTSQHMSGRKRDARRSIDAQGHSGAHASSASSNTLPTAPIDDAERLLSLQMALKCSDLSHLFADLDVHMRWVACLEQEFFEQGDREKAAGLPVSPLFDRDKPGVSKSQVGFYSFVAEPLFRAFTKVFKGAKPAYGSLMDNLAYWRKVEDEAKQKEATLGLVMSNSFNGKGSSGANAVSGSSPHATAERPVLPAPADSTVRGRSPVFARPSEYHSQPPSLAVVSELRETK